MSTRPLFDQLTSAAQRPGRARSSATVTLHSPDYFALSAAERIAASRSGLVPKEVALHCICATRQAAGYNGQLQGNFQDGGQRCSARALRMSDQHHVSATQSRVSQSRTMSDTCCEVMVPVAGRAWEWPRASLTANGGRQRPKFGTLCLEVVAHMHGRCPEIFEAEQHPWLRLMSPRSVFVLNL